MERCDVCGQSFERINCRQRLCGDRECLREKKLCNGKDWRRRHPDYMAAYMGEYRKL